MKFNIKLNIDWKKVHNLSLLGKIYKNRKSYLRNMQVSKTRLVSILERLSTWLVFSMMMTAKCFHFYRKKSCYLYFDL